MTLIDILTRSFTWWNGQTWGTYFYTRRHGNLVGTDAAGNSYYRAVGPIIDPSTGPERRWVVFVGEAEASKVPPDWRGWLTHTVDVPPSENPRPRREWEQPHLPNMTGTSAAYRPPGSSAGSGRRPPATGDYQAWSPDGWSPDGREEEGKSPDGRDVPKPISHPGTHGQDIDRQKHSG